MSENADRGYSNTCALLSRKIQELTTRVQVSNQNAKLKADYDSKAARFENSAKYCSAVMNIVKPMIDDLELYIDEKRKTSMQNINNALRLAGEIIKDATEGIYFQLDGDEACLVTPDGLEVDAVEGCGYRQISSVFLRSVVLSANRDTLPILMLDEVFSLVSQENSASLSTYLNLITRSAQVISIEQKPQVYANIDYTQYTFKKGERYAEVSKEVITHDS